MLSGFSAGPRTEALLVSLEVCLSGDTGMCNIVEKMPLVCAIADLGSQDHDVILPTDVVTELRYLPVISVAGPVMSDVMVTYDDTQVCNESKCHFIHSFVSFVSLIMPPTTRNGHTTSNHYKQKPNPKLKITKIHEMHIAHKT